MYPLKNIKNTERTTKKTSMKQQMSKKKKKIMILQFYILACRSISSCSVGSN